MIGPRFHYITGRETTVGENCQNKTIHNQLIGLTGATQSDLTQKYCKLVFHERRGGGGTVITTNVPHNKVDKSDPDAVQIK